MVINHNMSSLFASRMEGITTGSLQKSMENFLQEKGLTGPGQMHLV